MIHASFMGSSRVSDRAEPVEGSQALPSTPTWQEAPPQCPSAPSAGTGLVARFGVPRRALLQATLQRAPRVGRRCASSGCMGSWSGFVQKQPTAALYDKVAVERVFLLPASAKAALLGVRTIALCGDTEGLTATRKAEGRLRRLREDKDLKEKQWDQFVVEQKQNL